MLDRRVFVSIVLPQGNSNPSLIEYVIKQDENDVRSFIQSVLKKALSDDEYKAFANNDFLLKSTRGQLIQSLVSIPLIDRIFIFYERHHLVTFLFLYIFCHFI